MARYSKIFAALDGGSTQEAVVRRTLSIAHDNNAEVLFGNVIDSSAFNTMGIGEEELAANVEKTLRKKLRLFLERAENDECIPAVNLKVGFGQIAETLENDLIKPFDPDLVICGVRGFSGFKYAFVGSVSNHLVHHVDCDVTIVRPERIEEIPDDEYAALGMVVEDYAE